MICCNECGRWWRCYGHLADLWADFIRYGKLDGNDPTTVNTVCPVKAWPIKDDKVANAGLEYGGRCGGSVLYGVSLAFRGDRRQPGLRPPAALSQSEVISRITLAV